MVRLKGFEKCVKHDKYYHRKNVKKNVGTKKYRKRFSDGSSQKSLIVLQNRGIKEYGKAVVFKFKSKLNRKIILHNQAKITKKISIGRNENFSIILIC